MGLCLLPAGCSRRAEERRPAAVFVSVPALAKEHPLWGDVAALDRQIAFVRKYSTSPVSSARVPFPVMPKQMPQAGTTNAATLTKAITDRLSATYARQRAALEDRLARQHEETRAASVLTTRNALSQAAEVKLQQILRERGLKIQDLDLRLEAYDSLMRSYTARGWDTSALSRERQAVAERSAAETAAMRSEMGTVLDALAEGFAEQAGIETALALKSRQEGNEERQQLEQVIGNQKALLLDELTRIGTMPGPVSAMPSVRPIEPSVSSGAPPVASPKLEGRLASLVRRRNRMARFVDRSTRAIVRSVAARRGITVEFTPRPGLADGTAQFRGAVQTVPRGLEKGS